MSWLLMRLVGFGVAAIGLGACVTMAGRGLPASSGSVPAGPANRAIRELYVGPGVTQYFLQPQQFMGPNEQQTAEVDIVARDSAQIPRYGLLHLSVVAPAAVKFPIDTLLLSTAGRPVSLLAARVLYAEPKGQGTLSRLEAYLTPAQLREYLNSPMQTLLIGGPTGRRTFLPSKKAQVALRAFAARVVGPTKQ
ncbi:hypothetical protein [Hymenobacter negativus]|uniref:DUF4369 domain-containing protein n=1 Tax=Hymenobacter negativus TaxID=2795026 RepID=A0ABS3QJT4_9BACT|nr:hypothetical protein [Hymenobacter negativus]MBO2011361.1 hypothetical protein [Hymenobacter negativus]